MAPRARVQQILQRHGVKHLIAWILGGEPFITPAGSLGDAAIEPLKNVYRRTLENFLR